MDSNKLLNTKTIMKNSQILKIYPAVEITTDKEAHVLVYGLA